MSLILMLNPKQYGSSTPTPPSGGGDLGRGGGWVRKPVSTEEIIIIKQIEESIKEETQEEALPEIVSPFDTQAKIAEFQKYSLELDALQAKLQNLATEAALKQEMILREIELQKVRQAIAKEILKQQEEEALVMLLLD
jgi:predicted RNA-binding Zn ribbon-like protein